LPEHVRHPGAGCFAHSSAVQVDVLLLGQPLDFLIEVIGFDPDGALDARRIRIVVAVTANVDDQNPGCLLGREFLDSTAKIPGMNWARTSLILLGFATDSAERTMQVAW